MKLEMDNPNLAFASNKHLILISLLHPNEIPKYDELLSQAVGSYNDQVLISDQK
jgi:hypothetical protein